MLAPHHGIMSGGLPRCWVPCWAVAQFSKHVLVTVLNSAVMPAISSVTAPLLQGAEQASGYVPEKRGLRSGLIAMPDDTCSATLTPVSE